MFNWERHQSNPSFTIAFSFHSKRWNALKQPLESRVLLYKRSSKWDINPYQKHQGNSHSSLQEQKFLVGFLEYKFNQAIGSRIMKASGWISLGSDDEV